MRRLQPLACTHVNGSDRPHCGRSPFAAGTALGAKKRTSAIAKKPTCVSALRSAHSSFEHADEVLVGRRGKPNRVRTALLAIEKVSLHRPFAFDFERAAGLEAERIAKCLAGRGGDMDATG